MNRVKKKLERKNNTTGVMFEDEMIFVNNNDV